MSGVKETLARRIMQSIVQLDLFTDLYKQQSRYDHILKTITMHAQNLRYLCTRVHFTRIPEPLKKNWLDSMEKVLSDYVLVCEALKKLSCKSQKLNYNKMWAYNSDIIYGGTPTEYPTIDDILSHYKSCQNAHKSVTLSYLNEFSSVGKIIDRIGQRLNQRYI